MVRPVDDDSAGRRLRQTGLNEYLADFEELMLRPPQKRKTKINRAKNRNYVSMMAYPMRIADGDDNNDDETREIFPIRSTWFPLELQKNSIRQLP